MLRFEFFNIPPYQVQNMRVCRAPLIFRDVMQFIMKDAVFKAYADVLLKLFQIIVS